MASRTADLGLRRPLETHRSSPCRATGDQNLSSPQFANPVGRRAPCRPGPARMGARQDGSRGNRGRIRAQSLEGLVDPLTVRSITTQQLTTGPGPRRCATSCCRRMEPGWRSPRSTRLSGSGSFPRCDHQPPDRQRQAGHSRGRARAWLRAFTRRPLRGVCNQPHRQHATVNLSHQSRQRVDARAGDGVEGCAGGAATERSSPTSFHRLEGPPRWENRCSSC